MMQWYLANVNSLFELMLEEICVLFKNMAMMIMVIGSGRKLKCYGGH